MMRASCGGSEYVKVTDDGQLDEGDDVSEWVSDSR
jgi:hypothetical protein